MNMDNLPLGNTNTENKSKCMSTYMGSLVNEFLLDNIAKTLHGHRLKDMCDDLKIIVEILLESDYQSIAIDRGHVLSLEMIRER